VQHIFGFTKGFSYTKYEGRMSERFRSKKSSTKKMVTEKIFRKEALLNPTVVYKYRSLQQSNECRLLTHREIYLPPPSSMKVKGSNDCLFTPEFLVDQVLASRIEYFLAQLDSMNNKEQVAYTMAIDHPFFDGQNRKISTQDHQKNMDKHLGLFCCSTSWNNLDLWQDFGDDGNGVCIGLNFAKLKQIAGFNIGGSVFYFSEGQTPKVSINGNPEYSIDQVANTILSMPSYFEHEEEYRFCKFELFPNEQSRKVYLPQDCFEEIILGENIDELPNIALLHELKRHNKVFKLHRSFANNVISKIPFV
jgi:hypothetical protein